MALNIPSLEKILHDFLQYLVYFCCFYIIAKLIDLINPQSFSFFIFSFRIAKIHVFVSIMHHQKKRSRLLGTCSAFSSIIQKFL